LVVKSVGAGDLALVPPLPVAGLVAPQQHDRVPARIEREQRAQVAADRPDLLHVVVTRALERVHERSTEARTPALQLIERGGDPVRVFGLESDVPRLSLWSELDLPGTSLAIRHAL
jgi:hypothetical protein